MKPARFAKNLRAVMKKQNLTMGELARRCGVTTGCISLLAMGKRRPSLNTLCAIIEATGVTFERLVR